MRGPAKLWRGLVALALSARCVVFAAPPPSTHPAVSPVPPEAEKISPLEAARGSFRHRDYAAAAASLGNFIDASRGTPKLDEAREMLVNVAIAWSAELDRQGQTGQGARALIDCAGILRLDPRATELKTRARRLLEGAYDASVKRKDYERALRLVADATVLFPEQFPLADTATLRTLQAGSLAAQQQRARPEYIYERLRAMQRAGVTRDVIEQFKLDPADVALSYAKDLQERGWYVQAAVVLREELIFGAPSPSAKRQLEQAITKALEAAAQAWINFANPALAQRAMDQFEASPDAASDPGILAHVRASFQKLPASREPPHLLASRKPLQGDGIWNDKGFGYVLDGEIQIGSNPRNHGGESITSHIDVHAGSHLDGGTIVVSQGILSFKGAPDRPVILRGVHIECEYTGEIKAQYTIFEDCTFTKTGSYRWDAGYSAKWDFADCLLLNSNFAALTRMNYGIKLVRCSMAHCTVPPRALTEAPEDDAAKRYREEWNQVEDCDFYGCELSVSALWMTRSCNLYLSQVIEPATFFSKSDLDVQLAAPPEEADVIQDAISKTDGRGTGKLRYSLAPRLFPRKRTMPLWRWADDLPPLAPKTGPTTHKP